MSQTASLPAGIRFEDEAPPAMRVRGYWSRSATGCGTTR